MGKVSIVVPIFNTESYLNRCIDSILNQTYKNLEIILVDDGSTDRCAEICDEYTVSDNRVRVVHKQNGGEASARNAGLVASTGEYIAFCDSDDELLPDAIEKMMVAFSVDGIDLTVGAYLEKTSEQVRYACTGMQIYSDIGTLMLLIMTDPNPYGISYILSTINGKLFRANIIKEQNISFNETLVVGNDTEFIHKYLLRCKKVYDIFAPVYIYYKYDTNERVQGMAWIYPDFVFFNNTILDKCWKIIKENPDNAAIYKRFLQTYLDKTIGLLVKSAVYEDYFPNGILPNLQEMMATKLIKDAVIVYLRQRKTDSRLIPLFFKLEAPRLLLHIIRRRAKNFRKKYGRAEEHIRMMCKK
jgi:glycosyltransferase involved in cell wall biosynthesis